MKYTEMLTKEMFENIVAFSFSEPGAMGANGDMTFYRESGDCFTIDVLEEFSGIRMSWLELKQFAFRQARLD